MAVVRYVKDLNGVYRKLSKGNMKRGKYALANQMLADMDKFVPLDGGDLRTTGHRDASGDSVIWKNVYAKAQFYGTNGYVTFKKYTTPGTGKRWDLKAKSKHMKDWKRAFVKGAGLK